MMKFSRFFSSAYIAFALTVFFVRCDNSATVYATRKNIIESVYASGKIIAENEHYLFSLTNGAVLNKLVHEDDTVRKDQVLFEINNITATSGLQLSGGKVKLLQQFTTSDKFPDKAYIRSDCNGIIYQLMKEQGEAVRPNEPVALIGDASKRIIRLGVDQQDIKKIKTGQEVLLKTDITGDSVYTAVVTKIYQMMNESNQSFRVDATFSEPFPYTFIHSPVEANIIVSKKQDALVLPRAAVGADDSLLINHDGSVQKIKARTGIATSDYIEILGGIDEKTRVILESKK